MGEGKGSERDGLDGLGRNSISRSEITGANPRTCVKMQRDEFSEKE